MLYELYSSVTQLGPMASAVVLSLCLVLVFKGRPEIAAALYLTIRAYGDHTWTIGGIAQTWIFLATMLGAAFVFYVKRNNFQWPANNRWIVPWLLSWWIWSSCLLFLNGSGLNKHLLKGFILWTLIPLPVMLVWLQKIERVASFSKAYVIGTMLGGFWLLRYISAECPSLMINPLIGAYGGGRLPIVNYHAFAYSYGISVVMLIGLFQLTKSRIMRGIYVCSIIYCFYFLYFSISRQTFAATVMVSILYLYWLLSRKYSLKDNSKLTSKIWIFMLLAIGAYSLFVFYHNSSVSFLRYSETMGEVASTMGIADRREFWVKAVQAIFDSYFVGTAYETGNVHNIFLSVLANEGMLGFIFMIGFLGFGFIQIRNVFIVSEFSEVSVWRMAFASAFISTLIHSQYSGDNISAPELFWAVLVLWYLNKGFDKKRLKNNEKA